MPIKKDETGKRWVEMEELVPGTPEQVWQAVATGPGNAAWFVEGQIEPRVGGAFSLDFGEGTTTKGEVTAWEPPHRFAYVERDWEPGAPPVATEITITARSGNRCVLRMVHSLFTSVDDWDDQVEGFESGWPGYFAVLRLYLARFAGTSAASFLAMQPARGDALSVWQKLGEATGLAGASVGERRASTSGGEVWSGVVEHVHQDARQRYVLLRLDSPADGALLIGTYAPGVTSHEAAGDSANVSVGRYFYGNSQRGAARERAATWRSWLSQTFG
ncbi:MAG: ATPase [Polyangiaceae bacterium]|jgi:uncharacterized protein YndB with AHSA1/START domain|nr:ATPase [Polyangiaceae bacterium]